jgi:WXG100 family type VII secretion target
MADLLVEFAQLQAAIDHMAHFQKDVETCLQDVDQTMAKLRATWHGDASDSQKDAQAKWDEGADQMNAALDQLRKIAQQAHTNYNDAVKQNKLMWDM